MNYLDLKLKSAISSLDFKGLIELVPCQFEVFQAMLENDYVVFRGARAIGKTFLLGTFYSYLARFFPEDKVGILSPTVRQVKMVVREINKLGCRYDLKSLEELDFTNYDVILVDEAQALDAIYLNRLVGLVLKGQCKKLIFCCSGYYTFNKFLGVEHVISGCENSIIINKTYQDLPVGFIDIKNINEARNCMSDDEFRMEYLAEVVWSE
jgi:hypothetical protein